MNDHQYSYNANQLQGLVLAVVYGYEIGRMQAESIAKMAIAESDSLWENFAKGFNDLFGDDGR